MDNWKVLYKEKLKSGRAAVGYINSGDRVFIAGMAGRPEYLVSEMIANANSYRNVKVMHGISHGGEDYAREEYRENFVFESLFGTETTRKYLNEGNAQFYPHYYYDQGVMIREGVIPVDVFMVQVTPPDEYGYCSVGTIADVIHEAVGAARVVICQVNRNVPWCSSPDTLIHVSKMNCIVEKDEPLPVFAHSPLTEIDKVIGGNCASLVNDGDTIELGIGSIPDAVCQALKGKKNLGVHSEMISDGMMELWEEGVITNSEKSCDRGMMTASFVMGSRHLYDMVDKNPAVLLRRVSVNNHPFEIAKEANMIGINTCIEVDLMGQVVSGTAGTRIISGTGGQMDFMRGIDISRDGKGRTVIAFSSTHTKNGVTTSRIKPVISKGSAVTITRQDVDYFVTEYGIARLKGKTLRERARELINIAHPDFREELENAFNERFK